MTRIIGKCFLLEISWIASRMKPKPASRYLKALYDLVHQITGGVVRPDSLLKET